DVDAARVARVAARLWHGDAKRAAYVPKHRCDVRHLWPPYRARRRTRRSGWRPAVGPADEGRRCLCRSAREQCTRSFGQGQFLVAVLKHRVEYFEVAVAAELQQCPLYALRADAEKPQHNTTQQRIANSVQVDPVVVGRMIVCLLRTSIDVTKKSRPFAKEPYKLRVPQLLGRPIHVRNAVKNCGADAVRMDSSAGSRRQDRHRASVRLYDRD